VKLATGWALEYRNALLDYLRGADESGLHHAYELGRKAIEQKLGILEVVAIQHELFAEVLKDGAAPETWRMEKLSEFFVESLSPYEMTQRGYQEANARLLKAKIAADSANRDLESFSYSIAHDLRAPLRAIGGFTRIFMEDYGATLEGDALKLLDTVLRSVSHMGRLIDGLLEFSRTGRAALHPAAIDMSALTREVVRELTAACPERTIEVVIPGLSPAWGDPVLVRQVLVNLIGNAIKYTGHRAEAKIEVGETVGDSDVTYWVKDNGAGFDMENSRKLFAVFQRLHPQSEFEGTGVGLALVLRIVERHGGRVWATAKVNEGATFYFTLPKEHSAAADQAS